MLRLSYEMPSNIVMLVTKGDYLCLDRLIAHCSTFQDNPIYQIDDIIRHRTVAMRKTKGSCGLK